MTVQDLDIRGGYKQVRVDGSSYARFEDCSIGGGAWQYGLYINVDTDTNAASDYYNIIRNISVRSQIGGNHNSIYYNVAHDISNIAPHNRGGAFRFTVTSGGSVCHHNKLYNNTIVNVDGPAVYLKRGSNGPHDNEVINNIIFNCGLDDPSNPNIAFQVEPDSGGSTTYDNIFKNNIIYRSNNSKVIRYRGTDMTVNSFNAINDNIDRIGNNIGSNPMFEDSLSNIFNLRDDSPAIDQGLENGKKEDFSGTAVPQNNKIDIGAFEKVSDNGIASPNAPSNLRIQ